MDTPRTGAPRRGASATSAVTPTAAFRDLLAAARSAGPVEICPSEAVSDEAKALARLIEAGERRLGDDIEAALDSDPEALAAMAGRAAVQATLADLFFRLGADEPAVADLLLTLAEVCRGEADAGQALALLAETMRIPEKPVRPRDLDEARRFIAALGAALDLRQAALRIIAAQGGPTDKAGHAAERQVEREGVVLLGQLESACAVADETLRRRAVAAGLDADAVSATLAAAFAARARRVGYPVPLVVRRPSGWRKPLNPAHAWQAGYPVPLDRLRGANWQRWPSLAWAWLDEHRPRAVPQWAAASGGRRPRLWPLVALALLLVVALTTWRAWGVAVKPIGSTQASLGVAAISPRLPAGTPVRVVVRTTGGYSLEDVARYFGLTDPWAMSLLAWVNSTALQEFQATAPRGQLYTTPLPAGLTLEIPAVVVASTTTQEAAAMEYGVSVEGIRRLAMQAGQGVYLVPVGRNEKLAEARMRTAEALDLDVRRPTVSVGTLTAVR